MKTNYHTHLKLCHHATGMTRDYLKEAVRLGLSELGMTDHGPIPAHFMDNEPYQKHWKDGRMTLAEFHDLYLPDLAEAASAYQDKIRLWKGLEIEYVQGHDDYYRMLLGHLDYLVLGSHYFIKDGSHYNCYDGIASRDIGGYADVVEAALSTGFFKVLVHPDLYLFNYRGADDQPFAFDMHAEAVARRIFESAIRHDVFVEINARGIQFHTKTYQGQVIHRYPREAFWRIARDYPGLKIIISADAHDPKELAGDHIDQAKAFAAKLDLKIVECIF